MKRLLIVIAVVLTGCTTTPPHATWPSAGTSGSPGRTPVMGVSQFTAEHLDAWFAMKTGGRAVPAGSCVGSVRELATLFIEEGRDEGVRGDLAFIQAMLETGWLQHSSRVPPSFCNYSGIGAVDAGTGANRFATAREGVRAQIQHLRAYADPTTTCANFTHPNVDPRCKWVLPKGKAPTWNVMGNGNWATDPGYSNKILTLATSLSNFVGR